MATAKHYLVAIDQLADAPAVLEKASTLASAERAVVRVMSVVYDEGADAGAKASAMQSARNNLAEVVDPFRDRFEDVEILVVWNERVSQGVIDAAETFEADLVIKTMQAGTEHFKRHPRDWELLHDIERPVLLVTATPWQQGRSVLVAADLLDVAHDESSKRAINAGVTLSRELDGRLCVVYGYPIRAWTASRSNLDLDYVRSAEDVEAAARDKLSVVAPGVAIDELHVYDGGAVAAVSSAVKDCRAEVLVLGNAVHHGVASLMMGSTVEALLRVIRTDLFVLPT